MKIFAELKDRLFYNELDQEVIQNEIHQSNLERVLYLGLISIPAISILILLYYIDLHRGSSLEYAWRSGIISIHSTLLFVLVIGTLIAYRLKREKAGGPGSLILIHFAFFTITAAGIATAVQDQLVTPSIVPFMLSCTITALMILIKPIFSLLYFSISYVIIYIALSLFQINEAMLLSNRLDALIAVALGFVLSLIMWKNNIVRYRQSRIILDQKKEIEGNYQKLMKYAKELDTANNAKTKFFSIIAHDLRGPITSTINASEILLEADDYSIEQKNHLIRLLNEKLKKTYKLLENLLTWSKSQGNRISFNPKEVNLYSLIEENLELLYIIAEEKKIEIINHVSKEFYVVADKEMLNTVIRNLVANAIKFTHERGAIRIEAKEKREVRSSQDKLEISIWDNGIGMTEEIMDKLFQIDKKVFTLGTKNETGTGLGLILVKDFIEKQGGEIKISSELNKGSCFTFTLPFSVKPLATMAS